ncbi:hypothetical protein J7F01_19830 [Streptomyces sp. ISL-22]|uniref:Uncharacterized protein n=1 Tax=Streptomyces curacoi TaxID=146536 RepID=A0A117PI61_9ACTN|nr:MULTISPECIES: DUF5994 family protein [Streptomyces]KUM80095.1 hypothetical protein AQI70_07965 [Streptomyces curacoi]MBT2418514.1 hypothetical protein [Streptomyces sp. ISL-24]MBT2434383.1 hypothetical protein [Streptomyces sp. ISL-22]
MPGTDPPPATGLLPDGAHESLRPGTALLRMETTHDRRGVLDGAWWPRSRDIAAELPGLIGALTEHLGPVSRVGLDSAAWDGLPTRLVVDGRVVHIDASSVGDDTVLVTRGDQDLFSLLVVPPDTPPAAARAAMAQAVRADNVKGARRILVDTGAEPLSTASGGGDTERA